MNVCSFLYFQMPRKKNMRKGKRPPAPAPGPPPPPGSFVWAKIKGVPRGMYWPVKVVDEGHVYIKGDNVE